MLTFVRGFLIRMCSVTQLCPTFCNPVACSLPGSSIHEIFLARILEWVAISSSRGSSWYRYWIHVCCIARWILHCWTTREASNALLSAFVLIQPSFLWASLVAQLVKNLPAVQETQVRSLGWEDPLEKEMATHSSILAWKISWTEKPGGLQSMGSQRVGHDWATNT